MGIDVLLFWDTMTFFFEMSQCIFKVGIYLENFYPKGNSAMCYSSASTYIFGTIKNPPSGCQNICPSKKLNHVVVVGVWHFLSIY